MTTRNKVQLDLVWADEIRWEDLPERIRQQAKEAMVKLLWAAVRKEVNDDE